MSLDTPDYQAMRASGSRAASLWRVGDVLYYLGLLPAVLVLPVGVVVHFFAPSSGVVWVAIVFASALVVCFVGGSLKSFASRQFRRASAQSAASAASQHAS